MTRLLHAMPVFLHRSMALMVQYRFEMLLWAFWGVVYPAVAMAMWSSAAKGSRTPGLIQGFEPRDFAAYFLLTMIVGHLCTAWDVYEMGYYVRSGTMSPKLLRPILPIWEALADNFAFKASTVAILAPIWIGVALLSGPRFSGGAGHIILGVVATVMGAGLNFLWGYLVALSAFWVTKSESVGQLWFGAQLFFGGRLAPLTILPPLLATTANFFPFKWIIYFPAAAMLGRMPLGEVWVGLLCQLAWLTGGILLFRIVWPAAVKRYSAVGA